jgi:ubiquinol-cytochrome c reductase cytochrome b subunit
MHPTGSNFEPRRGPVFEWINRRTGLDDLLREGLDEPIPGGARFAYVFGSALLFIFISQVITGIWLALYYVPSSDHAHTTVAYITKAVSAGSLLRSIHAYGSSAMVILLLLHVTQSFLYGSYKGRRELLWLSGCVLFVLVLCMAFTGYLLPWDQKAYFATAVGTNIAGEIPLIGPWLKELMRGGADMGTLTVSRFFVAHVLVVPAMIFGFVALHVFLFRQAGAAGPISEDPVSPKQRLEPFYPRQVVIDGIFALTLIAILACIAHFDPFTLGPQANPADTRYLPRPEWYYIPIFQWLKYWPGSLSFIGVVVIPGIVAFLFASLPFIDRRMERRPWKRPIAVGCYVFVFLALFGLGYQSYRSHHNDPGYAAQLAAQEKDTAEFMNQPFQPESSGAVLAGTPAEAADPLVAKGKGIYEAQSCNACHGDAGVGTPAAPKLTGISKRLSKDQLAASLKSPTPKMIAGGMSPLTLPNDQMDALVAYLEALTKVTPSQTAQPHQIGFAFDQRRKRLTIRIRYISARTIQIPRLCFSLSLHSLTGVSPLRTIFAFIHPPYTFESCGACLLPSRRMRAKRCRGSKWLQVEPTNATQCVRRRRASVDSWTSHLSTSETLYSVWLGNCS